MPSLNRYLLTAARTAARIPFLRRSGIAIGRLFNPHARHPVGAAQPEMLLDEQGVQGHLSNLRSSGYSTGLKLTGAAVDAINNSLHRAQLVEDGTRRRLPYAEAKRESGSAAWRWINPHETSDTVRKLAQDERLWRVAQQYLGCDPILHSTQIWLLHPPAKEFAQGHEYGWHYDIDDFRFLKVFFYLTDTRQTAGQHMLVSASHRDHRLHRFMHRRVSDEALRQRYADKNVLKMHGGVGEGFFEDTWLYHRASPPVADRIMMQFEFCATGLMRHLEQRISA